MNETELSASLEDYLETIYFLSSDDGKARPKDIAERMGVRAASVTGALRLLGEREMIHYAPYSLVSLTEAGVVVAKKIAAKHEALLKFFTQVLGIDAAEAEEFACSMEHSIPDPILTRFIRFAEFTEQCPSFNADWREKLDGYFCDAQGEESQGCGKCRSEKLASQDDL